VSPRLGRAIAAGAAALLLLTGCGGDAGGDLRAAVAELTGSANGRDAAGVRRDADTVIDRLEAALRDGAVTPEQAAVIRDRTLAVRAAADEVDPAVLARREAEQAEADERARADAEREQAARAELERLAEERRQAEAEAQRVEQERQAELDRLEEERRQAEQAEQDAQDEDEDEATPTPAPRGTGTPQPTPTATVAP
jgi:hypothetical protein